MPSLTNDWEFFFTPFSIVDCGTWGIPFGRNGGSWGAIPLGVVLDIGKDMDCGTWGIPFGRNGGSWGAIPLGVVLDIGKDMD
jgi:hypothetical protein